MPMSVLNDHQHAHHLHKTMALQELLDRIFKPIPPTHSTTAQQAAAIVEKDLMKRAPQITEMISQRTVAILNQEAMEVAQETQKNLETVASFLVQTFFFALLLWSLISTMRYLKRRRQGLLIQPTTNAKLVLSEADPIVEAEV